MERCFVCCAGADPERRGCRGPTDQVPVRPTHVRPRPETTRTSGSCSIPGMLSDVLRQVSIALSPSRSPSKA